MKSFVRLFAVAAGIVLSCAPCFSAYLIEFKSGAQFITAAYWEEDHKIWFNQSGGFVGIEKNRVKGIRESELSELIRDTAASASPPHFREDGRATAKASSTSDHPQEANTRQNLSPTPSAAGTVKDEEIEKDFDSLQKRVTNADTLEKTELITLAKDMAAFRKQVLDKNLGHIYTDRLFKLSEMFDRIEKLVKLKS